MLKNILIVLIAFLFMASVTGCASTQKQQDTPTDVTSSQQEDGYDADEEEVYDNAPTAATKSPAAKAVKKSSTAVKTAADAEATAAAPVKTSSDAKAAKKAEKGKQDKKGGSPIGIILAILGVIAALLIIWFIIKKKKKDDNVPPQGTIRG